MICGSSVGSLIAAKLAEGDVAGSGPRAIDELEALWRGLRDNGDMWQPEPWFQAPLADGAWAAELRTRLATDRAGHARTRMALRATTGPVPGPFGLTAPAPPTASSMPSAAELHDRLDVLAARRRDAGAPPPPGM